MSIEQEFKKYTDFHIATTIQSALILFKDLYNNSLLEGYNTYENEDDTSDRAYLTYFNFVSNSNDKEITEFYNICWNKIKNVICDTQVLNKDIT